MRTMLAATAVLTICAATAVAPATAGRTADERITAKRVGEVPLGGSYRALRAAGRIGRIRAGCPLDPGARVARLQAPLRGWVDLTRRKPRRVRSIAVTGGASARGVGIGDRLADIRAAFPRAKVDRDYEETFRITLVRVPRGDGGRIEFALGVGSQRIRQIGVPGLRFCE